jgi:ketosteroid isomerase-like protein
MTDAAAKLVADILDAWNARDFDGLVGLLAPDVEWYDLGMAHPPARGREAVRAFSASVIAAFPDFRFEVIPPLCFAPDGTRCAVHWSITATHTGVLSPPGLAPTNRRAQFTGVDLVDIKDGQVARILSLFDPLAAGEQLLGIPLRPPSGSIRERLSVRAQRLMAFVIRNLTRPKRTPEAEHAAAGRPR